MIDALRGGGTGLSQVRRISPNFRRLALKSSGALASISQKSGGRLWKFASLTDLTPETFLTAPVWYPGVGDPASLVPQKGGAA